MKAGVFLKQCSYEPAEVGRAVAEALSATLMRGAGALDLKGKRVLLKPNLAIARAPERAATTHPAIIGAAIDHLRELGAELSVGDSPAGAVRGVKRVWEKTGAEAVCRARGARLVNFEASGWCERSVEGRTYKISRAALECDLIVSLPKLKSHILTVLTGAIKNCFGCVPGFDKSRFHLLAPRPQAMSTVLVDVFSLAAPAVTLVDAVEAMDGNGPSSGRVRPLGFIAAGTDAVALDAVLARLVGIEPMRVPTTREAWRRGIGEGRLDHIALEGDPAEHLEVSDFRVPSNWEFALVPSFLGRLAARWFWVKPVVRTVTCTGCGDCVRACAASAIALGADGKAEVTRSRCVSCLCCIEVCPTGAVAPSKSALARLVK